MIPFVKGLTMSTNCVTASYCFQPYQSFPSKLENVYCVSEPPKKNIRWMNDKTKTDTTTNSPKNEKEKSTNW